MVREQTILQLLPGLESGGVERGTLEVARALVESGYRSLVASAGGRLVPQLERAGSQHFDMPLGRKHPAVLLQVPRLRRLLREQNVDLVHVRSRLPAWILRMALRGLKPPERPRLVSTVHGLYSVSRYSAIMTRADRVIAVSNTVRDYIETNYPDCPEDRIEVIPRGVSQDEFPRGFDPGERWRAGFFNEFPQCRDRTLLVLPGRLTRLKGHADFIRLVAELRGRLPGVHGLIVGGEDPRRQAYASEIRNLVRDLGLEEQITFTGQRSDIREIYAISSLVFSLSTKPESFGRTVLEALMSGVPVVGYDHGGVGEVLSQLFPAGKVPLGDQAALQTIATGVLEDAPEVPPVLGFSKQQMLDSTLALYGQLLKERRS